MSDSIDRVFVRAINTIRTLSSRPGYSSRPRPPIESRIQLYGMYKQATEGDVVGVMARPVGESEVDVAGQKKWDAWKQQQGLSKTEAKRRYVSFLISMMQSYASDTHEGRELLAELEYMWDQIKDVASDSEGVEEELYEDAVEYPSRSMLARTDLGASSHTSSGARRTVQQMQPQSQTHATPPPSDRFKSDMAWALRTINEEMADMAKQFRPQAPAPPRDPWKRKLRSVLKAVSMHVGIDVVVFALVAAILKSRRRGVPKTTVEIVPSSSLGSLGDHVSYHLVQIADGLYSYAVACFS